MMHKITGDPKKKSENCLPVHLEEWENGIFSD